MTATLLALGLVCVIAALIGGDVKALGVEIPALKSAWKRWGLAILGAVLLLVVVYLSRKPAAAPLQPQAGSNLQSQRASTATGPASGPKSELPKNTTTSEKTPPQNPKRRPVRPKKKTPAEAKTTPVTPPPTQSEILPPQQVEDGIVNNAPNNGTQVVQDNRQYGVSLPPPDMDFKQSQIAPWPDPPLGIGPMAQRERDIEMLVGPHAGNYKAGVSLVVTLKGPFKNPEFWIKCSASCYVDGVYNSATSVLYSTDPTIARVQFIAPTELPAGAKIVMDVRSTDKTKITVLAVGGGDPPN